MRASTRWSKLVRDRLAEMEQLRPGGGVVGPRYWDTRARRFDARSAATAERDPLLARLRRATGRRSTVLDVGAGPGRFSLALAPHVERVIAVDSSGAMIDLLEKRARKLRLANVHGVVGPWPEVDVPPAHVSVCSYVLPLVADAKPFLESLDACTTERAFLYLGAASLDFLTDPMWRHFHGRPRRPGPTYLDAVAVLAEAGIEAEVEVVERATRSGHRTLRAAVKAYCDQLLLPDDPAVHRELRDLLASWLVEDRGELRPPIRSSPSAIVSWRPRKE